MKFIKSLIKEYTFALFIPIALSVFVSVLSINVDNVDGHYLCLRYVADCFVPTILLATLSFLSNHFKMKTIVLKQYFLIFSFCFLFVVYFIYRLNSSVMWISICFLLALLINVFFINLQFFDKKRDSEMKKTIVGN